MASGGRILLLWGRWQLRIPVRGGTYGLDVAGIFVPRGEE
jgi:hypothetical protein